MVWQIVRLSFLPILFLCASACFYEWQNCTHAENETVCAPSYGLFCISLPILLQFLQNLPHQIKDTDTVFEKI